MKLAPLLLHLIPLIRTARVALFILNIFPSGAELQPSELVYDARASQRKYGRKRARVL